MSAAPLGIRRFRAEAHGLKPQMRSLQEIGFTRRPEVKAILDRYEDEDAEPLDEGDIASWEGMTLDDAVRLMELLPEWHADQRRNRSPSVRDMIRLGFSYPGIRYFGYRVPPEREDERISFEGFLLPKSEVDCSEAERLCENLKPDVEHYPTEDGDYWYFWWD